MAQRQLKAADWKDVSTDEAYKLSQAEFKGMVIQSLQDIREDIKNIQQDAKVRNWITFGVGSLAGIIASTLTSLGMKHG